MYRKSRTKKNESGVALILTLFVLTILIVIVSQFSFSTKLEVRIAKNSQKDLQNYYALITSEEFAKIYLIQDIEKDISEKKKDAETVDHLREKWGKEELSKGVGSSNVKYLMFDERSKLNVFILASNVKEEKEGYSDKAEEKLSKVIKAVSLSLGDKERDTRKIASDIISYLTERISSSETEIKEEKKEGEVRTLKELLLVEGVDEKLYYGEEVVEGEEVKLGLRDYLTIWTQAFKKKKSKISLIYINVNTASSVIFQTFSPIITEEIAERIIKLREGDEEYEEEEAKGQVFAKVTEFWAALQSAEVGLSEEEIKQVQEDMKDTYVLTVNSNCFSLRAKAVCDSLQKSMTVVFKRSYDDKKKKGKVEPIIREFK